MTVVLCKWKSVAAELNHCQIHPSHRAKLKNLSAWSQDKESQRCTTKKSSSFCNQRLLERGKCKITLKRMNWWGDEGTGYKLMQDPAPERLHAQFQVWAQLQWKTKTNWYSIKSEECRSYNILKTVKLAGVLFRALNQAKSWNIRTPGYKPTHSVQPTFYFV